MPDLSHASRPGWPMLAAVTLLGGCAGRSSPSATESVGVTESAIEGGHLINSKDDPVSNKIPFSTVGIVSTVRTGFDVSEYRCTGVILSSTTILTAAHCTSGDMLISLYPTARDGGALPEGSKIGSSSTVAVLKQDGVKCPPTQDGPPPDSCSVQGQGLTAPHYADIAIVTLTASIPAPWKAAKIAPRSTFGKQALAQKIPSSYAVGIGQMNRVSQGCKVDGGGLPDSIFNSSLQMEWVPIPHLGSGGTGAIFATPAVGDPGDSGGPIFQYAASGDLAVVGILSWLNASCDGSSYNRYTDVTQGDNYDWLVANGRATPADMTSNFGAAL